MPARKLKIELMDEEGNRYTITFEGRVTREKATKLLDLVDLLSGLPETQVVPNEQINRLSKIDKLKLLIEKHFPFIWFTSKDLQLIYEKEFNTPISLSTVSTYLTRMSNYGLLISEREGRIKRFKVNTKLVKVGSGLNF